MVSAMRPQARPKVAVAKKRLKIRLVFTRCPAVDTTTRKRAQIAYRRRAVLRSKLRGNIPKSKRKSKNESELPLFEANNFEEVEPLFADLPTRLTRDPRLQYRRSHKTRAGRLTNNEPRVFSFNPKNMEELHLPFLDLSTTLPLAIEESLILLRWNSGNPVDYEAWKDPGYLQTHETGLAKYATRMGPDWNLPPTEPPERLVATFTRHLTKQFGRSGSHLQIPANWPIFASVNWDQKYIFRPALTDSSESKSAFNYGLMDVSDGYDSDVSIEAAMNIQTRDINKSRSRSQLEMLEAMDPMRCGNWRYQTEERSLRRYHRRHAGFLDYNQASQNRDIWPQTAISAFMSPDSLPHLNHPLRTATEVFWNGEVGRLIGNVMATNSFPAQYKKPLRWPALFSSKEPTPLIDYTFRSKECAFGVGEPFYPLLYAAQQCRREDLLEAEMKLSMAFQPMMRLFIIYYLDTRSGRDEPMPPWLVLFGAIYDEDGLYHQACYPSFQPPCKAKGTNWGWGFTTYRMSLSRRGALSDGPENRGGILAELYRIQGHCIYVIDRLKLWDGYERACRLLSIK